MLYHVSENPKIDVFKPRLHNKWRHLGPVVFAINKQNSINYLFPRECPRIIIWKSIYSNEKDIEKFFTNTFTDKIIYIENCWLKQIFDTPIYIYTFQSESFSIVDQERGLYISNECVTPINVDLVRDLHQILLKSKIELRVVDSLQLVKDLVIRSTIGRHVINSRNFK